MSKALRRFWKDEAGQDLVEYALIILLVALAVVTVLPGVALKINGIFTRVKSSFPSW